MGKERQSVWWSTVLSWLTMCEMMQVIKKGGGGGGGGEGREEGEEHGGVGPTLFSFPCGLMEKTCLVCLTQRAWERWADGSF